jgi:hypothetical protein
MNFESNTRKPCGLWPERQIHLPKNAYLSWQIGTIGSQGPLP